MLKGYGSINQERFLWVMEILESHGFLNLVNSRPGNTGK